MTKVRANEEFIHFGLCKEPHFVTALFQDIASTIMYDGKDESR